MHFCYLAMLSKKVIERLHPVVTFSSSYFTLCYKDRFIYRGYQYVVFPILLDDSPYEKISLCEFKLASKTSLNSGSLLSLCERTLLSILFPAW